MSASAPPDRPSRAPHTALQSRAVTGDETLPNLPISEFSELTTREQQIHHHPRRQIPNPPLSTQGLSKDRIDHLERHLLSQLTQMTRRERTCRDPDHTRNDRLNQQRDSRR
jgi:hypothetical protein